MYRILLFATMLLSTLQAMPQQLSGRVADEQGQALEYVNVMLCQATDSSFVHGAVTDASGHYIVNIPQNKKDLLLHFSSVGYKDLWMPASDGVNATLQGDTQMLGEVVVKAQLPTYNLTAGGISTNVENSVLSKAGTAEDLLQRLPGVTKQGGSITVFGKGSPLIYVNGRKLNDVKELDNIASTDIKSVEVITTPGARYDATVNSVIRIKLRNVKGEGFGYDVRSSYYQSENTDLTGQLNYNYRHNHLDVFGTLKYSNIGNYSKRYMSQQVHVDTLWQQTNRWTEEYRHKNIRNITGVNYVIDADNSVGVRYSVSSQADSPMNITMLSDVTANGRFYDSITNDYHSIEKNRPSHEVNLYYEGKLGKTELSFNADYLNNGYTENNVNNEESAEQESRKVTSTSKVHNNMWAAKLVATNQLWGGNLSYGTEYTNTERNDIYENPEGIVPSSTARLHDINGALFAEYMHPLPFGTLTAGLRYEHVSFDYYEGGVRIPEQSRVNNNLFPSVTLQTKAGRVMMMLSYNAKTLRPTYRQLKNSVTYANRYTRETGNPLLKNVIRSEVSLMMKWKDLSLGASFQDNKNAIIDWAEQLPENQSVTLMNPKNVDNYQLLQMNINYAPTIGRWSPQFTLSMKKQWLTMENWEGRIKFNKPTFMGQFNNTLDFGRGWIATAGATMISKGHGENVYLPINIWVIDCSLYKSWMNDRLSLKLQGNDLLHQNGGKYIGYNNRMNYYQAVKQDSREVSLTLRYKFNTTRSKYKGTGAGDSQKARM